MKLPVLSFVYREDLSHLDVKIEMKINTFDIVLILSLKRYNIFASWRELFPKFESRNVRNDKHRGRITPASIIP